MSAICRRWEKNRWESLTKRKPMDQIFLLEERVAETESDNLLDADQADFSGFYKLMIRIIRSIRV